MGAKKGRDGVETTYNGGRKDVGSYGLGLEDACRVLVWYVSHFVIIC